LDVLGYSCDHDGFAFNFTSSPAARRIISDFIASNVKVGRYLFRIRNEADETLRLGRFGIREMILRVLHRVSII
jgi:hypothetical protein